MARKKAKVVIEKGRRSGKLKAKPAKKAQAVAKSNWAKGKKIVGKGKDLRFVDAKAQEAFEKEHGKQKKKKGKILMIVKHGKKKKK